ncbi:MAG: HAMP domain-containing protein, partial [Chloroflexales bacterium]|nr:HAMP domain-containing protein [Chloroflexales bacterium]
MSALRQLRWQLIAVQMLVVGVGVAVLAVTADELGSRLFAAELHRLLVAARGDPASVEAALLVSFRATVGRALLTAAVAAAVVGLISSLLLLRQILRPLGEIAESSRRIAEGRYDERVAVPASDELATVASSFNAMAASLEQVEQQRVALIGNVAHELRTPLTGIEGYLEGLVDGVFAPEPATFAEMQHEVRRLHRLVEDLQTLSQVEAGQVRLRLAEVDLGAVARRVVEQLRPQSTASSLEVVTSADVGPLVVRADPDRVAQILLNLVGNALRYTPEGGCITVRLGADQGQVWAAVEDTGVGIAADELALIFERFYRIDRSRARASGGSGIGLTIARHLAWAMGGTLTAASAGPGRGSTFTLTLPR